MKTKKQQDIADQAGISQSMLSQILSGNRRAGWRTAKKLAFATNTNPELWLEGSMEEMQDVFAQMEGGDN